MVGVVSSIGYGNWPAMVILFPATAVLLYFRKPPCNIDAEKPIIPIINNLATHHVPLWILKDYYGQHVSVYLSWRWLLLKAVGTENTRLLCPPAFWMRNLRNIIIVQDAPWNGRSRYHPPERVFNPMMDDEERRSGHKSIRFSPFNLMSRVTVVRRVNRPRRFR